MYKIRRRLYATNNIRKNTPIRGQCHIRHCVESAITGATHAILLDRKSAEEWISVRTAKQTAVGETP